jgi:hypothetical protein
MTFVEVATQAQLDALKPDDVAVVRSGHFRAYGSATVRAYGSATVTAYDSATVRASDSATVTAYGSATVRASGSATVTAYGSATVTAYDSATVRASDSATVTASGSATVRASDSATVRAYDSATVRASDSATVTASKQVPVHRFGDRANVTGGVLLQVPDLNTCGPDEWADYYGSSVTKAGYAVLFAAVDDTFTKGYAYTPTRYAPGDKPEAKDWNPARRCGGGLHLGPTPHHATAYNYGATRWVACRVKLADAIPLGDKVKVPRCVVLHEVTIDGERVTA